MHARVPLLVRILGWFFLNLALLAGALFFFLRTEFRVDALMAGRAGERVQQMADALLGELRVRPRAEWDDLLQRFGESYGIELALVAPPDEQIAGPRLTLPPEVIRRLPRRGPLAGRPGLIEPPPGFRPGLHEPPPPRAGRFRTDRRLFVHTTNPHRYWVVFPNVLPETVAARGPRRQPLSLIAVSETLSAGGLFFDYTPWLWAGGGVLIFSVLWWLPFVRGITRAVSRMTHATERIAEGRFDARAPERRRDELGQLGAAINRMAERLAGFVAGQKRFLGDVSHELCAPLARLQVALGILEQRAGAAAPADLEDLREEVEEMSQLVNELLSFSKASLGAPHARLETVCLAEIVTHAVKREAAAADQVRIGVPAEFQVRTDAGLLRRAVANLIRNARRHAGPTSPIEVIAIREGKTILLTVADSGPGVPAADLDKIFDPFYRVDPARDRATGGVGLGLAIVKTCVEACDGTVTCRNRQPTGLAVTLRLPLPEGDSSAAV